MDGDGGRMRLVLCGFVLGIVLLQQRPGLPGLAGGGVGALLFVAAIAAAAVFSLESAASRAGARIAPVLGAVRLGACVFAALLTGFGYAAWRADLRLRDALPAAW